jgi:hypothetical protein
MTTDFTSIRSDLQEIPALSQADEASVSRKFEWQRILASALPSAWLSFQTAALCASVLVLSLLSLRASAANLKPDTLKVWEEYVALANAQMQECLRPDHTFLLSDQDPVRSAKLRSGEILAWPAVPHTPKRVPSGLIHDWNGEAFIPNATLHDVLPVLRDYGRYKEVYKPVVVDSKAIATGESDDQFSMLLVNKALISKTALDTDFQSSYFRVSDQRWYSLTKATRIQEIAGYGSGSQHTLPEDDGTGLIWRIYSITRFEERDGGVYVEVEAIVLSRDIPISLRWMVDPIVRRVSRESVITSLNQTKDAIRSMAKQGERYAASGTCFNGRNCVATTTGASVGSSFVGTK